MKTGRTLWHILQQVFFFYNSSPKVKEIKAKLNKLGLIKKLFPSKGNIDKTER